MGLLSLVQFLSFMIPLSLFAFFLTFISSPKGNTAVPSPIRWFISLSLPLLISVVAYGKKSLNLSGLCVATIIGFILTISNYCFMASLLVFFITSSKATNYKCKQKGRIEEDFREGGQRNWIQVICNGGAAAIFSMCYLMENGCKEVPIDFITQYNISWFSISTLGAIGCANGDTWASELGAVLSSSDPYLITSLQRVPRGTNGGVSLIGLIVSALGGLVVAFGFFVTLILCSNSDDYKASPPQFIPLLIIGLFSGFVGSLIDSVLGAVLQYSGRNTRTGKIVENSGRNVEDISGMGVLGNHSVNLLSTFITAFISPYFAIHLWSQF